MLKLPNDAVIPAESVAEVQQQLQDIADEQVRKLARQIGANPKEEPYPGYFEDIARLGINDAQVTSSVNPASMYGPDGKPYAPWMVGKVALFRYYCRSLSTGQTHFCNIFAQFVCVCVSQAL